MSENIEITDEMLDDWGSCMNHACEGCRMSKFKDKGGCRGAVFSMIKSERAARKNNPGVWDNAPGNATKATVVYSYGKQDDHCAKLNVYTRELPKTLAREIAEKYFNATENIESCEAAINEYKESVK